MDLSWTWNKSCVEISKRISESEICALWAKREHEYVSNVLQVIPLLWSRNAHPLLYGWIVDCRRALLERKMSRSWNEKKSYNGVEKKEDDRTKKWLNEDKLQNNAPNRHWFRKEKNRLTVCELLLVACLLLHILSSVVVAPLDIFQAYKQQLQFVLSLILSFTYYFITY